MESTRYPRLGRIVREDPALDGLIDPETPLEVVTSGFDWSEGPVWIPEEGCLLFSDIPPNTIYRWKEGEGVAAWMKPSGYTGLGHYSREPGSNGLTLDWLGRLVCCEHGDRRVSVLTRGGGKRTLVDNYRGRRLNSPNDVVFKSDGSMYFTDPPYGLPELADDPSRELDFCGIYRLAPDGELTLLHSEMSRPNGLAFSPDEQTLYVSNSDPERAIWNAFPVLEEGLLGKPVLFGDVTETVGKVPGLPDGLKVDKDGNLFATAPGGVLIFAPDGRRLGRIDTQQATSNCNWGEDGGTLFICADMYICRLRTLTRGAGWRGRPGD